MGFIITNQTNCFGRGRKRNFAKPNTIAVFLIAIKYVKHILWHSFISNFDSKRCLQYSELDTNIPQNCIATFGAETEHKVLNILVIIGVHNHVRLIIDYTIILLVRKEKNCSIYNMNIAWFPGHILCFYNQIKKPNEFCYQS